jgi:hypothetical protein
MNLKTSDARLILRLFLAGSSAIAAYPLLEYLALAPFGSKWFLATKMVLVMPMLAALAVLVISPFLLFFRRLRQSAVHSFCIAGVVTLGFCVSFNRDDFVRMPAFYRLAKRSVPLVQAIRAYEAQHGQPPPSLAALVPDFLSAVPNTGMGAYPDYKYYTGEEAARYDGNSWILVIPTSRGVLNWDSFMYFPLQNYPKTGYGGVLERIEDWAYVHE